MIKYCFFTFLMCFTFAVFSQDNVKNLNVKKSNLAIKIDGILDESAWQNAQTADQFKQIVPFDTSMAKFQTQVKMTFDDTFIYVSAVCFQPKDLIIVPSLKRDPENGSSDLFFFTLDTYKDRVNAFYFGVTPFNVQKEGLIDNGSDFSNYWDNKWYSATKIEDDKWIVEIAIPFKTIRYRLSEGQESWRVNFARFVMNMPELSSWSPCSRNFRPINQAFAGIINFEDKLPKPGANVTFIPYLSGGYATKFPRDLETLEAQTSESTLTKGVGFDAKIGITPSLNLDLTVNPDFSQVEVDRQVTNLSRFEIFFPERRQFFLENSDLFDRYGFPNSRPFFTRRIGIATDTVTGNNMLVPILAGARISGKLNDKWRIGLLNMQTGKKDFEDESKGFVPPTNFSVASLQRRVLKRSYISAVFTNKANLLSSLTDLQKQNYEAYNRVAGLEFNFYSPDGNWEGESYLHKSITPTPLKDATSMGQFMGFNNERFQLNYGYTRIGENYQADMGYVPRRGAQFLFIQNGISFYPKNKAFSKYLNSYGFFANASNTYSLEGQLYDREAEYGINFKAQNLSEISISRYDYYTFLNFAFDPTNSDGKEIAAGSSFRQRGFGFSYESSNKYKLKSEGEIYGGQYFNGHFTAAELGFSYRIQPIGTVTVNASYNDIRLPAPYSSKKFFLISPKAELSFSRSVFFSTFFQYNVQANNFNINSRLQWRFKPVSDLFLVYTDNYFAEAIASQPLGNNRFTAPIQAFAPKNRALVLKMTYWLSL